MQSAAVGKQGSCACTIDGCRRGGKIVRGMCDMHYSRWKRHRDPGGPTSLIGDVESRFWRKVDKSHVSGCWLWTGYRMAKGYGQFFYNGKLTALRSS